MKNLLMFDYDGAIVDSLIPFRRSLIQACARNGSIAISNHDFLKIFDGNMYGGLAELGIASEKIPQIIEDLGNGILRDQASIRLVDGIEDALERLSSGNNLALITSNVTSVVESYLRLKKIGYFTDILGADQGTSKAEKISLLKDRFPGRQYYYLGDTLGDMLEGRAAGVKTVALTWGWHNEDRLLKANPNYIARTPRELTELF